MSPETRSYLLLQSTSHVMRAEKLLLDAGIRCRLVPVPRALSSQCGVCLRLPPADLERARQHIESHGLVITQIHNEESP